MNSSHYRKMTDGKEFAVGEENPPLGLGGLYRYLKTDSQYRDLLKWEFEVLAEYRDEVAVELTDVRDLEHLDRALALMKEAGLKPGENGFELGMRMDNPDNYIFAGEYINRGHLAFVHTDAQRLSQTYLAADRNNQHVPVDDIVVEANLKLPIRMIAQAAAEAGIPMAKTEPIHPAITQLTQEMRRTGFKGVNYFLIDGYRVNASIVQKQGDTPEQIAHALAKELAKRGGVDARFNTFYGLNPNWTYTINRSTQPGRTDEIIINHIQEGSEATAGARLAGVTYQDLAAKFREKAQLLLVAASQISDTGSAIAEMGR
jgi:hypothetical protein